MQPAKASDAAMIKAWLITFSTDKGLSRERQTFVLGRMEAESPVSPIFGWFQEKVQGREFPLRFQMPSVTGTGQATGF